MKIKELFEDYLKYYTITGGRTNTGNCDKTLYEKKRFIYGPIHSAVGDREVTSINEYDFAAVSKAGEKHGTHGSQRSFLYFKQLLKFARRLGYKTDIDLNDLRVPHVAEKDLEYLTPEELTKVRAAFDLNDIAGLRSRALMEFLMGTALRISEACSIDIKDINWDTGEFRFVNCKSKKEERMICPAGAMLWLQTYMGARKDGLPHLFVSGRGRLLPSTSKGYMNKVVKPLGIQKTVCHHVYRKTCASYLLLETDIKAVQNFLRHTNPEVTLRHYTALTKTQSRENTSLLTNKYVSVPV